MTMEEADASVPQRVLVTGGEGFTASHLLPVLEKAGFRWTALSKRLQGPTSCAWHIVDLEHREAVKEMLALHRADAIVHLAGRAHSSSTHELFSSNVFATLNLCDALTANPGRPRLLNIGSSAQYGPPPSGAPVVETDPMRPVTPYGSSKAAQELVAMQYGHRGRLDVIAVRTFNLIGPGQAANFACAAFAKQVAEIEAGLRKPVILVGRLDTIRDFVDVRDAAQAYLALLRVGVPGEAYNVCSGVAVQIGACIEVLRGLANVPFEVRTDPARVRAGDIPSQVGDPGKTAAVAGWQAAIRFEDSLLDLLESWRSRIRVSAVETETEPRRC
jgi:GDP-4-dehydro-6-deoxy-D-mannose reductase